MIGREKETEILTNVLHAKTAQFVAITGRRRIGKTYLVRSFFKDKINFMEVVGKKGGSKSETIRLFVEACNKDFDLSVKIPVVNSWRQALKAFTEAIHASNKPHLLFLDELPWLAGKDAELLSEIEHFWNAEWSEIKDFKLVVCGSATSWVIDNIINNKAGLHNRLTAMIHLKPFSLSEVEEYLLSKNIKLNREQIISLYICIGGVPYYLDWIKPQKSVPQIIQELCFIDNGRLSSEFESLLDSLFIKSKKYKPILYALSNKRYGLTAKEIATQTKIKVGGTLKQILDELEACHFIRKYQPFGTTKRNAYYRLIDEFVMFHYGWIEPASSKGIALENDYWLKRYNTPQFLTWAGYNFETICHKHTNQIVAALGISGIKTDISHWNYMSQPNFKLNKDRYQIDLVIDRADKVINLCEIKFTSNLLILNKKLIDEIKERESVFHLITKTRKQITSVVICSGDIDATQSEQYPIVVVKGEELFRK